MSDQKRTTDGAPCASSKRRKATITTFNKWKTQFEHEDQTLLWLCCDVSEEDKTVVEMLWCEMCKKHEDGITGMKNFCRVWISGSSNQKTSNIINHATSEQYHAVMSQVRADAARASNLLLTSYSPIAQSLLVMDNAVKDRMKFDICYVLAKESMGLPCFV